VASGIVFVALVALFLLILTFGLRFSAIFKGKASVGGEAASGGELFDPASRAQEFESLQRIAKAEADAELKRAQQDAAAIRRAAATEADSVRRAAESDAASAASALVAARQRAQAVASEIIAEARAGADRRLQSQTEAVQSALTAGERRLRELDGRQAELATAHSELEAAKAEQRRVSSAVQQQEAALLSERESFESQRRAALERVGGLSADEAKEELLSSVEAAARREAAVLVRSIEAEARTEGVDRARAIVSEAVQRVASQQTSETVVSVLQLPSDEMKGRIIGREGRNIRAFESVTGVNVIIDDTPEAVLLSCFDPVRRETGRITLERLVSDGRIHPHRIEEVFEEAKSTVAELCLRAARDALAEVGITDLDEHLLPTLGRLKYRTSYGQNVLGHLIETAHVAGVMASELGVEPTLIKRAAFLHDIGKALTHEVEGSHAIIGAELLRRYGESEAVAHAVEAHHNEVTPRTIEAVLTQAADSCSAGRPGARRESLEAYVKRLERIEEIASARPGVEKVFAMQAGREVRVMVLPNEVDDLEAGVIAREVAKQIEDELTYPGQIRVTVVRESRATEVAH
jgi:ribonuclease Y